MTGKTKTVCPYYISEGTKGRFGIICKGFEGVDEVIVVFKDKEQKRKYQENFCFCRCYKGCPVALLLEDEIEESL